MARPERNPQPDKTQFVQETFESPLDLKRHDVPERHAFGEAFLAPSDADTTPTGPAPQTGSAGKSEKFARADHRHAFEGGGGSGGVTAHNQLTGLAVGDDHPQYTLTAEAEAIAAAAVNTHAAAGDPHTQYLTSTEADAMFLTPAEGNGLYSPVGHGHVHSSLTGLSADDHPQYLNNARGDARYAPVVHNHDAAYLSPAEVLAGPNVTIDTTTTPGSVIIGATPGGGGGVTDHGLLTGLADNDHPQYALSGHGHTAVSEVEIAAADPIGANPTAELWYDTDAVPTQPYALGIMVKGTFSVGAGTIITTAITTICTSFAFTPLTGRRYRLVLIIRAVNPSAAASTLRAILEATPAAFPLADAYVWVAGAYTSLIAEVIFSGNGVSTTFSGKASANPNNVVIHPDLSSSNWYLEDVGPAR